MKKIENTVKMKNIKLILLFAFILILSFFVVKKPFVRFLSDSQAKKLSAEIVEKCKSLSQDSSCYEEEVLKVAQTLNMVDSFKLTKEVQTIDPSYAYCHVLAHKLSFLEAQRRPNSWKEIITECPVSMCNYGCLHGSLIEHYRGEVLDDFQIKAAIPELKDVCEARNGWNPSDLDKNMCYHALGHLNMYMTGADINKSLEVCRAIGVKSDGRDYYETCIEGVFMTIFQGIDPDEVALVASIKPKKEDIRSFCSRYKGVDLQACNRESFPIFFTEIRDPKYLSEFCSFAKSEYELWKCYSIAVGNIAIESLEKQDFESFKNYCLALVPSRRDQCFANFATRIVQTDISYKDESITICNNANNLGIGRECFRDLIYFFHSAYLKGDSEIGSFCSQLPINLNKDCVSNNGNYE